MRAHADAAAVQQAADHAAAEERMRTEHAAELKRLRDEHRAEVKVLGDRYEAAVRKAKDAGEQFAHDEFFRGVRVGREDANAKAARL